MNPVGYAREQNLGGHVEVILETVLETVLATSEMSTEPVEDIFYFMEAISLGIRRPIRVF